jgi:hypothetical protein
MREVAFAEALENELRLRGVSFDRGELLEFVEEVWTAAVQNPDIRSWADQFLGTTEPCTRS